MIKIVNITPDERLWIPDEELQSLQRRAYETISFPDGSITFKFKFPNVKRPKFRVKVRSRLKGKK